MKIANNHQQEEYKTLLNQIRKERQGTSTSNFAKFLFTFVLAVFFAVICVIIIENTILLDRISFEQADDSGGFFKFSRNKKDFQIPFSPKKQNILLLGIDSNGDGSDLWEGTRSDTIMVVNIDPRTRTVKAISIPRDSKVFLPENKGVSKINSAHAIGGVNLVKKTLKETFGIKIDHYIIIHDEAVEHIVDALGGIPIYVEKPMKYHDWAGRLHIDLNKGNTVLNGKQAVGYLRYRKIDKWLEGFLFPIIQKSYNALIGGGYLALNVSDVYMHHQVNEICKPMVEYAQSIGFKLDTVHGMKMAKTENISLMRKQLFITVLFF